MFVCDICLDEKVRSGSAVSEFAIIRCQALFRGYLVRKKGTCAYCGERFSEIVFSPQETRDADNIELFLCPFCVERGVGLCYDCGKLTKDLGGHCDCGFCYCGDCLKQNEEGEFFCRSCRETDSLEEFGDEVSDDSDSGDEERCAVFIQSLVRGVFARKRFRKKRKNKKKKRRQKINRKKKKAATRIQAWYRDKLSNRGDVCAICLNKIRCDGIRLKCNKDPKLCHRYCTECAKSWAKTGNNTCPLCRFPSPKLAALSGNYAGVAEELDTDALINFAESVSSGQRLARIRQLRAELDEIYRSIYGRVDALFEDPQLRAETERRALASLL